MKPDEINLIWRSLFELNINLEKKVFKIKFKDIMRIEIGQTFYIMYNSPLGKKEFKQEMPSELGSEFSKIAFTIMSMYSDALKKSNQKSEFQDKDNENQ